MVMTSSFVYVPEKENAFLSLFPHRYDYIYADHPNLGDRPQWQTESRYPLSDRLIQQGSYLYGVRFGAQTHYCLLDIDVASAYHPQNDNLAISRIVKALEPLGLVSYLACTSSYSQGLHLYFPLPTAQNSWQLSTAVTNLLENQGFKCQGGQLEVFPNSKLYVVDDTPNLFNAHRLPLQAGSYLLNEQLEPISSSQEFFVQYWQRCQQRNSVETKTVEQVLKQTRRRRYRVSQRAEKFLNDLNAEIEQGWTGKGQTNYLLGRITMRTYIFHHILQGGVPLSGDVLVETIVAVARSLPGYREWCGHQHEIQHRAEEWARCIENSHYFPYGAQHGKYKAKVNQAQSAWVECTWNEQRSQAAQKKIQMAMADLWETGQLPETPTARFKKLVGYGIGGSTLYKHKALWHPDLWKTPQTPLSSNEEAASALAAPATAAYPPSLLSGIDRNAFCDGTLSDHDQRAEGPGVRNDAGRQEWRQVFLDLKARRLQQKQVARSQSQAHFRAQAQQASQNQLEKVSDYLRSRDPILMKAGLEWLLHQDSVPFPAVIPADMKDWPRFDPQMATLVAVCERLLQLGWSPQAVRASLGNQSLSALSMADWQDWLRRLSSMQVVNA